MIKKPKVAVAMSGGVDSSVAAALLVEQGYPVFGVMLRLWVDETCAGENRCCQSEAVARARRIADELSIPFHVIAAQKLFYRSVVEYAIREYSEGRTPIPCMECNRVVRWVFLLREAQALGAELLATGHYARVNKKEGRYRLLRGMDPHKDQSYMLSALGQMELAATLFPLGEMTKPEVREKARALGLVVANQPDSQDLCFLPDGDYRRFLAAHAPQALVPGPILDLNGEIIGRHEGLAGYTIGQRKGIRVSAREPYYVMNIDLANNALVVGPADQLGHRMLLGDNIHWVDGNMPKEPFRAQVRIRYAAHPEEADVIPLPGGQVLVEFSHPLRDITPGQAAVFYQGDECLGMAYIREAKA